MAQPLDISRQNPIPIPPISRESSDHAESVDPTLYILRARIAIYDSVFTSPNMIELEWNDVASFLGDLPAKIYSLITEQGASIPFTIIKELTDNLIHADFSEIVVSILDHGNTLRIADQGPGITDKQKALLPGYTSANIKMRDFIKGVGAGLCIVNEFIQVSHGRFLIEDNLQRGTVVTISLSDENTRNADVSSASPVSKRHMQVTEPDSYPSFHIPRPSQTQIRISQRENQVFELFKINESVGPTLIRDTLGLSLGTASRVLDALEEAGYITNTPSKKRVLTDSGYDHLYTNPKSR